MVAFRYSIILDLLGADPADIDIAVLRGGNGKCRGNMGNISSLHNGGIRYDFVYFVGVPVGAIRPSSSSARSTSVTRFVPPSPGAVGWVGGAGLGGNFRRHDNWL